MGCMQSTAATEAPKEPSLAKPGKLTSDLYSDKKPPTHWADTVFLVPHEWLRREMQALEASTKALPDSTTEEDAWKAELMATWMVNVFAPVIHMHHKNEEDIYLPFMKEKGCNIPDEKIGKDHTALMKELDELEDLAKTIVEKKGTDCADEVKSLKEKVPTFVKDMKEHLKEEEETLPPEIKAKLTQEESDKQVEKIIQAAGLDGLQTEIPGVLVSSKEWMTDEFYAIFEKEIPPPILKIQQDVLVPNYLSYHCAMRDAPTMSEKPGLDKKPFDPSMLPPPPPAEEAAAS